jgi:hypothetical protein
MSCENKVRKWYVLWFVKVVCGGTYLTRCRYDRKARVFRFAGICRQCGYYKAELAPAVPSVYKGRS